ncbi:hypothetical protein A2774_02685 [Candidatus Roizmanbacteria bacterium RIFCSPHIGHO2_01_FULL_39_12c]|uniref:Glycosyltransferase 2-like domain-containing protein n=1 Tax=Candidatus Roizmanbacteria bacterium RIFCSPHIGHO2_01_FULL_39_12c TaxID=1802031 RepID=A0A1F7GAK4_9BACT|nr:MAG: hypothetical protein A2774_02685 [Candidatus Roizmanbacteria bacterium RIFCSPHIGHO2_01_FULL_39_12c]
MKYPEVAIAICTYNRAYYLNKTIELLLSLNYPKKKYSILIIDDCSSDNTYDVCNTLNKKNIVPIKYVRLSQHTNLAKARNQALLQTKTSYLIFIDDDIHVNKNWLKKLIILAVKQPTIGLIGGGVIPRLDSRLTRPDWFTDKIIYGFAYSYIDWGKRRKMLRYPETLITANCLLNLQVLKSNAYFNPLFGPSRDRSIVGEDIELNWRLMTKGIRILYDPSLTVYHTIIKPKLTKSFVRLKHFYWGVTESCLQNYFNKIDPFFPMLLHRLKKCCLLLKRLIVSLLRSKPLFDFESELWYHLGYLYGLIYKRKRFENK